MRTFEYPIKFARAKEGGWVITCRDLPEAISQAAGSENRLKVASGCVQAALEGRMRHALEIPRPSPARGREVVIAPPVETVAKVALYEAMKQARVSKSELARRLGISRAAFA